MNESNGAGSVVESIETIERLGFELFGVLPGAEIRDDGGAIMFRTGVRVALCNGVFKIRWDQSGMEREIERYAAEFASTGTPFMIHTTDASTPRGIGEALKRRGFTPEHPATMFTLDLAPSLEGSPLPAGMSIRRIATRADMRRYIEIFVAGFQLPEMIADVFKNFYDLYGFGPEKNYQSLLLSVDGKPAAIVSLLGARDAAGVRRGYPDLPDDLCTMMNLTVAPWARGRFLGFRIAREAVKFARACGYRRLCTTGTPQGMGIYRRAPLTEVGGAQRWTWQPNRAAKPR